MEDKIKIPDSLKEFFKKLKSDKKAFAAVLIGVVGMLLIMFSELSFSAENADTGSLNDELYNTCDSALEVQKFVESIKGAGKAKVLITYECTEKTVFAKNTEQSSYENKNESKSEYIIIDSQNGETGLTEYIIYPEIRGVAVVCEGADNPIVKQRVVSAISALFSLSSNKISVTSMTQ